MPKNYLSCSEYGAMHGSTKQEIARLCRSGSVRGAIRVGRQWAIPKGAKYPVVRRGEKKLFVYRVEGNA